MPDQPAAWLAVAARNKALDRLKRDARSMPFDESAAWRLGFAGPESLGRLDDTLALMFVACHPALERDEQTMLTLKTVCGFDVKEIARAYLSTPDAVAQRLVRAKRKIRDLNLAFEIPEGSEMTSRLPALLDTVYLLFTGGYTAGEGEALIAPELCAEALRLALLLAEHPRAGTGATHALAALLCFQHARAGARVSGAGELILLADQDRARWDRALIARGLDHLQRAMTAENLTAIHIEAGIASLHATAADLRRHGLARGGALLRHAGGIEAFRRRAAQRRHRHRLRRRRGGRPCPARPSRRGAQARELRPLSRHARRPADAAGSPR